MLKNWLSHPMIQIVENIGFADRKKIANLWWFGCRWHDSFQLDDLKRMYDQDLLVE